jgi:hypothetical protein
VEGFDDLLARHRAFWTRGEAAGPLLSIKHPMPLKPLEIPVYPGIGLAEDGYLLPEMLDPARHYAQTLEKWGSSAGGQPAPVDGDLFRILTPYLYVPWLEAIADCPIHYFRDSGTMYPERPADGWERALHPPLGETGNPWRAKLREFHHVLCDLSGGRYPVGVSQPMRGPIDILAALVGVPEMCLAFVEQPTRAAEALNRLTDLWIEVVGEQLGLLPAFAGGMACCEQYGLWVPGPNAVTQCDLAVAISPAMYRRFLTPCDERIGASMSHPIMHLHSVSMHVLDAVLAVTKFAAIQIGVDPGPADPPLLSLLPAFRRVQAAGKPLIIHCSTITQAELDALLDGLSPRGLLIAGELGTRC